LLERLPGVLAIRSPQAERKRMHRLLGAWLAVTLHARGFVAHADPGAEVSLARDGISVEPDAVVRALADGTLTAKDWRARCEELGSPAAPAV
jgi:hypothetical protein